MERLETIKSVVAIFRDILLIIAFVVIIVAGLTVVNFVNSIDVSKLSCEGLVNSIMSGDFDFFGGSETVTETYEVTGKMLTLMSEIESAAMGGDNVTALAKLDELGDLADQAGMTEAVAKIDELKQAVQQGNYMKALSTASVIKKMFRQ